MCVTHLIWKFSSIQNENLCKILHFFLASGMICFEKRLGCLDVQEKLAGEMIEANVDIFQLSAELKFSMGLHNYFPTPKWKRFVAAEDFFFE